MNQTRARWKEWRRVKGSVQGGKSEGESVDQCKVERVEESECSARREERRRVRGSVQGGKSGGE